MAKDTDFKYGMHAQGNSRHDPWNKLPGAREPTLVAMVTKILDVFAIISATTRHVGLLHRLLHKTGCFIGRPIWLFLQSAHDCWQTRLSTIFDMNFRLEIGR